MSVVVRKLHPFWCSSAD